MRVITHEDVRELRQIAEMCEQAHSKLCRGTALTEQGVVLRDTVGFLWRLSRQMLAIGEYLGAAISRMERVQQQYREALSRGCYREYCHGRQHAPRPKAVQA